jgi:hypothetical protein
MGWLGRVDSGSVSESATMNVGCVGVLLPERCSTIQLGPNIIDELRVLPRACSGCALFAAGAMPGRVWSNAEH